ncbi:MAG: hypothetical protein ACLT0Y_05985 [Christensenellales bacterium]
MLTELIKVRDTIISHDRVGIIEVMGNNAAILRCMPGGRVCGFHFAARNGI